MVEVEIITGDITTLKVDAIVNAANCGLLGGGGVDGAIHAAAGKALFDECWKLVQGLPNGRGETGQAYATGAGQLPCRFVFHTPGPVYVDGRHGEAELLSACYANSLRLAEERQCKSIAFPCISTGVYGYPKGEAATVACTTVMLFPCRAVEKVIFCCFSQGDTAIVKRAWEALQPK